MADAKPAIALYESSGSSGERSSSLDDEGYEMNKKLLSVPFSDAGHFSKAEMLEWLGNLADYVGRADSKDRGGDALRLEMSIEECRSAAENDDEAELIRRGIRLGLHLASFDRKQYHSNVARSHGSGGRPKTVTDEQILDATVKFRTRQEQADHLGIGKRQLEKRLSGMK